MTGTIRWRRKTRDELANLIDNLASDLGCETEGSDFGGLCAAASDAHPDLFLLAAANRRNPCPSGWLATGDVFYFPTLTDYSIKVETPGGIETDSIAALLFSAP
jgi:hypothetical protein